MDTIRQQATETIAPYEPDSGPNSENGWAMSKTVKILGRSDAVGDLPHWTP